MDNLERLATQCTQNTRRNQHTLEKTEVAINNGQPREKLATSCTQNTRRRQNTQHNMCLDTTIGKQTYIMKGRHQSSYKQLEVKTNRMLVKIIDQTDVKITKSVIMTHFSSGFLNVSCPVSYVANAVKGPGRLNELGRWTT